MLIFSLTATDLKTRNSLRCLSFNLVWKCDLTHAEYISLLPDVGSSRSLNWSYLVWEGGGSPFRGGSLSFWDLGHPHCPGLPSPPSFSSIFWSVHPPQNGIGRKTVRNLQTYLSGIIYSLNNYLLGISYILGTFRICLFWTHSIYTIPSTGSAKIHHTLFLAWEKILLGKESQWAELEFPKKKDPVQEGENSGEGTSW